MFYTIYKITNKINNKIYIGKHQTKDLNDKYMGSGRRLRNSIVKYGIENFEKEILFQFDTEEEMNSKEAELVTEEFCLREDTYNMCIGGQGGFSYIHNLDTFKDQVKKGRISANISIFEKYGVDNISQTPEFKKMQSSRWSKMHKDGKFRYDGFKNKTHSQETKDKIGSKNSLSSKGEGNSQYGTMWITDGINSKKILKYEIIPDGWYKGRKQNTSTIPLQQIVHVQAEKPNL